MILAVHSPGLPCWVSRNPVGPVRRLQGTEGTTALSSASVPSPRWHYCNNQYSKINYFYLDTFKIIHIYEKLKFEPKNFPAY